MPLVIILLFHLDLDNYDNEQPGDNHWDTFFYYRASLHWFGDEALYVLLEKLLSAWSRCLKHIKNVPLKSNSTNMKMHHQ